MVLSDLAASLWIKVNQPSSLPTVTPTRHREAPTGADMSVSRASPHTSTNGLVEYCEMLSDVS